MALDTSFKHTAIPTALVWAPREARQYSYREKMGMMPSTEFFCFFDDFDTYINTGTAVTNGEQAYCPAGWQGCILDSGTTVTLATTAGTAATGVLSITDATASEGAAIYLGKGIQLTAGKKFFIEARVRTDDVTDNAIQIGLSDLTAVTNPEDLWTTTADNLVAFGILDGAATTKLLCDKSNSGSTAETGSRSLVANTWHVIAVAYDGVNVKGYVDGYVSNTWSQASTTIPTGVAMAPFLGALNGNGGGGAAQLFDYFRVVVER